MTLAVDTALLREPNLWVPGKAPIGPVKIKKDHPLARHLVAFFVPSVGGIVNLANNNLPDFISGTPEFSIANGMKSKRGGAYAYSLGDKSFNAGNGLTWVFSGAKSSTAQSRPFNLGNISTGEFNGFIAHNGGNVRYQGSNSSGTINYTLDGYSYPINEPFTCGATLSVPEGTNNLFYIDDKNANTYKKISFVPTGGIDTNIDNVCFGARYINGSFDSVEPRDCFFALALSVFVQPDILLDIAKNPFQLLEPA